MKQITLSKGKFTIVDDENYEFLMQWKWYYWEGRNGNGYALRKKNLGIIDGRVQWKTFRMHRFIVNAPSDMHVDHINFDPLDNRKSNLRVCTAKQNSYNKKKLKGVSKYKGVSWKSPNKKWQAAIKCGENTYYLGLYNSEEDAAQAYNFSAVKYFGEFAALNKVTV